MRYSDVIGMLKTADVARSAAVKRHRQAVANGTAQPFYRPGDVGHMAGDAWESAKRDAPDMLNFYVRAPIRGILTSASGPVQFTAGAIGDGLHNMHAIYDAAVNYANPAYRGQSIPQRLNTAMSRTRNGWTSRINNWAEDYGRYMEEGMNAVPGLAYTNDFETRHPGLRAAGERTGTVIGGLGISALAGAVATPAMAPAWIGKAVSYMPGAVSKAVTTGVSTVNKLPWYWRDLGTRAVQSLPGMPVWAQAAMGYGNLAYGYASDAAQGMKAAGDQSMLPGCGMKPGAIAQAGRGAVPQRPPGI